MQNAKAAKPETLKAAFEVGGNTKPEEVPFNLKQPRL